MATNSGSSPKFTFRVMPHTLIYSRLKDTSHNDMYVPSDM